MAEKGSSAGRGRKRAQGPGEQLSGPERRTALIAGDSFAVKAVQYSVVDDLAMFEGDVILGTVAEVERRTEELRQVVSGQVASGVVVVPGTRRWPNCQVPFEIASGLANQNRVTDAIAHWESVTRYRFIPRTAAHADFVTFQSGSGCSSSVGRQGGQQFVNLGTGCTTGNAIHEIGHVVGLWHEQSREDRDAFVTIHWDKIQAGTEHNFNQHITDGDDVGAYDYGSIMHYPRDAFSEDGSDTITPVDASASIGQRSALSAGDIAAANSLCPAVTIKEATKDPITDTFKEPPRDTIKEATKDPIQDTFKEVTKDPIQDTFKEPPRDTLKEVTKDPIQDTFKEPPRDTIKETTKDPIQDTFKEVTGDPKGPRDPGPGTLVEIVGPLPGGGLRPPAGGFTGPMPFAVATGHQAPGAEAVGGFAGAADPGAEIQALDAQLQQLAELLAQHHAQAAALHQQYDELAAALAAAVAASGGLGG